MNDVPKNELLSAYLDDELTAVEQAEVERLLAADPAARQTLDELRALSATLQALPRQKLGEDLSPQVLRVVERRMLTGEGPGVFWAITTVRSVKNKRSTVCAVTEINVNIGRTTASRGLCGTAIRNVCQNTYAT